SLKDAGDVETHRTRNRGTRKWVVAQLSEMGYATIPSEANFIMVNLQQGVRPVISGLRARGVAVGRLFPAMPEHMRVTIGRKDQMERFVEELRQVSSRARVGGREGRGT
ncbi:MAG TPA: aminotransferase class I/II-fold pyridoxal phosphate-dependent enzyme, partial [Thermoanaerobaculia bacterium]